MRFGGFKNGAGLWRVHGSFECMAVLLLICIAETAKANRLKPYEYFRYLLEELPRHGELEELSYVEQLLPWSETLPECCYQKKHPSTD